MQEQERITYMLDLYYLQYEDNFFYITSEESTIKFGQRLIV